MLLTVGIMIGMVSYNVATNEYYPSNKILIKRAKNTAKTLKTADKTEQRTIMATSPGGRLIWLHPSEVVAWEQQGAKILTPLQEKRSVVMKTRSGRLIWVHPSSIDWWLDYGAVLINESESSNQRIPEPVKSQFSLIEREQPEEIKIQKTEFSEKKIDTTNWPEFIAAVYQGYSRDVLQKIHDGADVDQVFRRGETPLILAAQEGHQEIVKILLDSSADANKTANDGWSALMAAVLKNHLDIVYTLLKAGANPDQETRAGETALMIAAMNDHYQIADELLQSGAEVDKRNVSGMTALMLAAQKGNIKTLSVLIEHKPQINRKDKNGDTALIIASKAGSLRAAKYLLGLDRSGGLRLSEYSSTSGRTGSEDRSSGQ